MNYPSKNLKVEKITEKEWNTFTSNFIDEIYSGDIKKYSFWKKEMGILQSFWACKEERVSLLGVKRNGELEGVARLLKVNVLFHQRSQWGKVRERGELQDVYLKRGNIRLYSVLVKEGRRLLWEEKIEKFGVSEWKSEYWKIIEKLGYSPYSRSVIIGWETNKNIPKEINPKVKVRKASPKQKSILKSIQKGSWGFFIPPNFEKEDVFIAYLKNKPVGSMYLNKYTGNIDFGIHVIKNFQRRRIGATLLTKAKNYFKAKGFKKMFVVRVLRLTKINNADYAALNFYIGCGGKILREYRGFKQKKANRKISIPNLQVFLL